MDIEFDYQNDVYGFLDFENIDKQFQSKGIIDETPSLFSIPTHFAAYSAENSGQSASYLIKAEEDNFGGKLTPNISRSNDSESKDLGKKSHSKDSLKFSRKIAKLLVENLASATEESVVSVFLRASSKIMNSIHTAFDEKAQVMPTEDLIQSEVSILQQIWKEFRDCLSYKKNNKICLVKPEHWNRIFNRKTFADQAIKACQLMKNDPSIKLLLNNECLLKCFCDILFVVNLLMVFTLVIKDGSPKGGKFIKEIETADNLIVLMTNPDLFQYYNHRSGKFASECCGACKICRSKGIPVGFKSILENTRVKTSMLIDTISKVFPTNLQKIQEEQVIYLLSVVIQSS